MTNLNLKGIWIPIEILTDKNLSDKEKIIYSIILFLSKENNSCYCSNSSISNLLNISNKQVSKLINSLKSKRYIDVKISYKKDSKQIETRTLIPILKNVNTYSSNVPSTSPSKVQYPMEQKVKNNKYNINNYNKNNINYQKRKSNYEQRKYESFDWNSLYANNNFAT